MRWFSWQPAAKANRWHAWHSVFFLVELSLKLAFGFHDLGRFSATFFKEQVFIQSIARLFSSSATVSLYQQNVWLISGFWLIWLLSVAFAGAITCFFWQSSWLVQRINYFQSAIARKLLAIRFFLSKSCRIC